MDGCTSCAAIGAPTEGWTGYALLAGALVFCPCSLGGTIAVLTAIGAGGLLAAYSGMVYAAFGALFLALALGAVVWAIRRRDQERHFERLHDEQGHEQLEAPSLPVVGGVPSDS